MLSEQKEGREAQANPFSKDRFELERVVETLDVPAHRRRENLFLLRCQRNALITKGPDECAAERGTYFDRLVPFASHGLHPLVGER